MGFNLRSLKMTDFFVYPHILGAGMQANTQKNLQKVILISSLYKKEKNRPKAFNWIVSRI